MRSQPRRYYVEKIVNGWAHLRSGDEERWAMTRLAFLPKSAHHVGAIVYMQRGTFRWRHDRKREERMRVEEGFERMALTLPGRSIL